MAGKSAEVKKEKSLTNKGDLEHILADLLFPPTVPHVHASFSSSPLSLLHPFSAFLPLLISA